jgi:3-hydroxyisobutyrate dehydrogenase-like beta-hydroxyacid dehydrogenase
MKTPVVGFIGAGKMGTPIVRSLLDNAVPVRLWARNTEVTTALGDVGATVVQSPAHVADTADVVIVCLYADKQVYDLVLAAGGIVDQMTPGSLLVVHSTVKIATLTDLDQQASSRGLLTLDAPLVGTPRDIVAGNLITLLGGRADAVAKGRDLVGLYSGRLIETGILGTATLNKLINNLLFAANAEMALEALDLAERLGLDPRVSLEVLRNGSGGSNAVQEIARAPSTAAFKSSATPYFIKDTAAAWSSARWYGEELGGLEAALARVIGRPGSTTQGTTPI